MPGGNAPTTLSPARRTGGRSASSESIIRSTAFSTGGTRSARKLGGQRRSPLAIRSAPRPSHKRPRGRIRPRTTCDRTPRPLRIQLRDRSARRQFRAHHRCSATGPADASYRPGARSAKLRRSPMARTEHARTGFQSDRARSRGRSAIATAAADWRQSRRASARAASPYIDGMCGSRDLRFGARSHVDDTDLVRSRPRGRSAQARPAPGISAAPPCPPGALASARTCPSAPACDAVLPVGLTVRVQGWSLASLLLWVEPTGCPREARIPMVAWTWQEPGT
jgi:hypothetical protein